MRPRPSADSGMSLKLPLFYLCSFSPIFPHSVLFGFRRYRLTYPVLWRPHPGFVHAYPASDVPLSATDVVIKFAFSLFYQSHFYQFHSR